MKSLHFSLLRLNLWPISLFVAFLTVLTPARATNGTWNATGTDGSWNTGTNWSIGSVPTGTATFNSGSNNTTITFASSTVIGSVIFDTANVAAYTIGGASPGTGTLTFSSGGAIQMTSTVTNNELFNNNFILAGTLGGGTLSLDNESTAASLTIAGPVRIAGAGTGTHVLTVTGAGNTLISGQIINESTGGAGGIISITKNGTGTLTLSNTALGGNTYTGATTVNAGVLAITGTLSASGTAVTVGGTTAAASGTPTLTGIGTVGGSVTLSAAGSGVGAAGTINPGTVGGVGTLTVGSISFQNGSTLAIDLTSGSADKLTDSGAVSFAGTNNITFTGSTGATGTTGAGDFQIMTIGSGTNLTTGAFTGTAPAFYRVIGSGTSLDLVHQANIDSITATPAASSIITGGSTSFTFTVKNSAPTNSSTLSASAASGTNTTGSVAGPITLAPGATSSAQSGLSFNGTTVGASQTGSFTVNDTNADNSGATGTVTVNVLGHASGSLSSGTLSIGNLHVGYSGTVTSSNSITASNGSGFLANLKGSDTTGGNISMTSVSAIAPGGTSGSITATLAAGQGVGSFANQTYTYGDDSTLSGHSNSVSSTSVTISGQVYSGTSTWVTNGSGSWGTLAGTSTETFGANWGTNQGSPGLDTNFKGQDTATFGTVGGSPVASSTVSLNAAAPNLNRITFSSSATSYTLAPGTGGSSITLSGTTPAVAVTAGSHTISAPIILGANTSLAVATGSQLTVSGQVSGSTFAVSTPTVANGGGGTTVLTSDNTYTGGTTISGGTTYINNGGGATYAVPTSQPRTITPGNLSGSGTGTGSVTVQSSGKLAGSGTIASTSGGITVQSGGTLSSGAAQTSDSTHDTVTGTGLTINNAAALSSALTVNGGATLTFALGAGSSTGYLNYANPNTNSTYINVIGNTPGEINFGTSAAINVDIVDLTAFQPLGGDTLQLRYQNPYLLIQAGADSDFNLYTTGGYQANGFVTGIGSGNLGSFNLYATNINGTTIGSSTNLQNLRLYLYNGDLEVVPEPGTWALMIGGLGVLLLWQRRKSNHDGMTSRRNQTKQKQS